LETRFPNKKNIKKFAILKNIMQIFIYIIIFIAGFLTARAINDVRSASVTKNELANIAQEGRDSIQSRIEKRKARILESARTKKRITNNDVEDMFCISDNTARRYLDDLEDEGKLTQIGVSGRGVYYEPV